MTRFINFRKECLERNSGSPERTIFYNEVVPPRPMEAHATHVR
ncbi:MAG: hypothetical protein ACFCUU_10860 [Cyclobacteriaceae bacterium]